MRNYTGLFLLFGATLLLSACQGFFGEKTETDFLDVPIYDDRTVAYVPVQPVIEGLSNPVDIIAGWDELMYVADAGTNEIISYDQAGNELARFSVPGVKAIAQDRRLDILALGTHDTTIEGTAYTLDAIYRIDLNPNGPYGLQYASIQHKTVHPFYFKSGSISSREEDVSFEGITVLADNRYYIARNGNSNATTQFGGPDNAILIFNQEDEYVTPIFVSTELGVFQDYFKYPKGLTSFAMPPQNPAVDQSGDFIFTSLAPDNVLRVQGIEFLESEFGSSYELKDYSSGAGESGKADGFLYAPNRFASPVDVTVTGDGTNYIFVVDAESDSLHQFNGLGYEGVSPPAGSDETKAIKVSLGGTGDGLTQFRNPRAVAYANQVVYVADAGNNRILRFKLTTDFD